MDQVDPRTVKIENIHQKILEAILADGCSLKMNDWHTCKTIHCRGGWVTFLAGSDGATLEKHFGMPLAAHIIYDNSSEIKVPWHQYFEFDNDKALQNTKECAEKEAKLI